METSIVSLLLLLLAAGIIEFASLYSSTIDISSAVRSAARVGATSSVAGASGSDYQIIRALTAKSGGQRTDIESLVIYRSSTRGGQPPPECTVGPPPPGVACNVYTSQDLTLDADQLAGLPATQRRWPESDRVAGEDYIGVWVRVARPALFGGLIPSPTEYTDNLAMRIAPRTIPGTQQLWSHRAPVNPGWNDDWFCWNGNCIGGQSGDVGTGNDTTGGS